jgi:cbb3-type cytochrome oxidase maturation protein
MEAMLVLILVSMVVAGGFLLAFIKQVKTGSLDDVVTPSVAMLDDATVRNDCSDVETKISKTKTSQNS